MHGQERIDKAKCFYQDKTTYNKQLGIGVEEEDAAGGGCFLRIRNVNVETINWQTISNEDVLRTVDEERSVLFRRKPSGIEHVLRRNRLLHDVKERNPGRRSIQLVYDLKHKKTLDTEGEGVKGRK